MAAKNVGGENSGGKNSGGKNPCFVHLHVHSSYSLLEGALTIARLAELAKKDRQPALALTDTDNMFGALEFSEKTGRAPASSRSSAARSASISATRTTAGRPAATVWPRIVLLAAREDGYRSLMRLSSRAYLETAPARAPAHQTRLARRRDRRIDRAQRRARWPARRGDRRRPERARAWRAAKTCSACSATGSISNCSATAWRRSARSSRR